MPQFFDVSGEWDAYQSNGYVVHFFNMQQSPRADNPSILDLKGRASHSSGAVEGRVEGALSEAQLNVTVFWDNETEGIYEGTFGIIGGLPGERGASQRRHPRLHAPRERRVLARRRVLPPVGTNAPLAGQPCSWL